MLSMSQPHPHQFELDIKGPFDFQRAFKDVTRAPFQLTERVNVNRMTGVFPIQGGIVGASISASGTIAKPHVSVQWELLENESDPVSVQSYFHDLFQTRVDLRDFYAHVADEPVFQKLIHQFHGFTFLRKHSFFEAMTTAIIDQQLNVAFATTLRERFIRSFGRIITWQGEEHWLFPQPEDLIDLTPADLRPLQFSQRKAEYILDFARGLREGTIQPSKLSQLDDDSLLDALTKIRGVGRWTAEYVGMLAFGRLDYLPAADIGLQRAIQQLFQLSERPTEAQVRARGEAWKPYRGLATFYLWHASES